MSDSPVSTPRDHRWQPFFAIIAVVAVLAIQIPSLWRPPFDNHNFRQAQTLSTIELFDLEGIDIAHPKTNYVGEPGVFVLELPLFQAFCAVLYGWFGPHTWMVRVLNLLFTFGTAAVVFALGKRLFSPSVAWAAVIVYLMAPLNLCYMASTLIDPSATFCAILAFWLAWLILHSKPDERPAGAGVWAGFALACLITALIKTLYLFPTCVLLAGTFVVRRRLTRPLFGAGLCIGFAVACFGLWLAHSHHVNDASYFTQKISPTTLLGFEPLTRPEFYNWIPRRVMNYVIGPGGAVLAVIAVVAAFRTKRRGQGVFAVAVLASAVPSYYLLFAKVNFPHDYYSIIISPYACLLGGVGAQEVTRFLKERRIVFCSSMCAACVALLAITLSVVVFHQKRLITPDPRLIHLQHLSQGLFDRYAFAMVFVGPDPLKTPPKVVDSEMPEAIYATGLRGTCHMVADSAAALRIWNDKLPHYQHLKYAVFFGITPPPEIRQACRKIIASDEQQMWFACAVD